MHPTVLDGAPGRHQRLGGHLAAEDPLALLVGLMPRKMLTSMGSRSSRLTRKSKDALMRPSSQAAASGRRGARRRGPSYPAAA